MKNDKRGRLFIGVNFERNIRQERSNKPDIDFGKELKQTRWTPYVGGGLFLEQAGVTHFLYGFAGISFNSNKSTGVFPVETEERGSVDFDARINYENGRAVRLGAGVDIENPKKSPLTIGARFGVEFGSTQIKDIDLSLQGEKAGKAEFDGILKMYDNLIMFELIIGYQWNLY